MKANELQIGDYVMLRPPMGSIARPELFLIREPDDLYMVNRFEPIRLSSAVIRKFGFIEEARRMRMHYRVGNCQFVIENVPPREMSVFMNEEFAGNFEILYVHELQHLLRLLKIEKNIEL